ncbi:MAG: S46 family peptidase [Leptospiraceae bacterium]|nr:S46 family peptidase [Leptospiraceae bacterium]MCP5496126.1 S46 family peptidase [Leptospiraceae bacterium]
MYILTFHKKIFILLFFFFTLLDLLSDEGMWTYHNIPFQKIEEKYNIKLSDSILKKLQLSSVRFNDGGSGAFVSSEGLVITNHHVAMGQLQKMSTQDNNYVKNGYYAKFKSRELKCPDLELNVLVSFEDVTQRIVNSAINETSYEKMLKKRKAEIAKIEQESFEKHHLRSNVVMLYNGGEYWLYRYIKYTDIRLVMAPEIQAASFGGDKDNFNYPRFALDYAFFRVYEKGKPIKNENFLSLSSSDLKENEFVIVSGHPGSTDRNKTVTQLAYIKEVSIPNYLNILTKQMVALKEYSEKGTEEKRRVQGMILGIENSLKALNGQSSSLNDELNLSKIQTKEEEIKKLLNEKQSIKEEFGNPWKEIDVVYGKLKRRTKKKFYERIYGSKLVGIALAIVRYTQEIKKPNEERLEEYRDSNLHSLKYKLFSNAPIYKDLEIHLIKNSFNISINELGTKNKFIITALGDKSVDMAANDIIAHTELDRSEVRKKLIENGWEGIKKSNDPLIKWMLQIEPLMRKKRNWYEKNIESVLTIESGKLSRLNFKIYGKSIYPDATFTLRLSYGKVTGYNVGDYQFPSSTTFYGLFDRTHSFSEEFPYQLSERIKARKNRIDLSTPLNFVTTNDITGGNSGSPVVDRYGNFVGIIFDGNCYSHVLDYLYTEDKARAVAVHSAGILESLKSIYSMYNLIDELTNSK